MSLLHKAGFGLIALAALSQANAAHALTGVDVVPTVTGTTGAYNYSYKVKPTVYSASQFAFTFTDPNVTFESVTGPLNKVLPTSPGSFINYSATGKSLSVGSSETLVFSSPDAPLGGTLNVAATGLKGSAASLPAAGPGAPVPEASTTVSLGLMLALGLGGVVVMARKKKLTA